MTTSKHLDQNFKTFLQQVEKYKEKYANDSSNFKIIAVSKKFALEQILELYQLGQLDFAENYLNEALQKIEAINKLDTEHHMNLSLPINIFWHYIGKIQSNKIKQISQNFSWVHSVDSINIAEKLNYYRLSHLGKLQILIQINLQNDSNKSGIAPEQLSELVEKIKTMPNLQLRGLMCILNLESKTFEQQFQAFNNLKKLLLTLNKHHQLQLDTLSMGMSADYEAAIAAGSTMLRIGQAIFGTR